MEKALAPPPEGSHAKNVCCVLSNGRRTSCVMMGAWRCMKASISVVGKAFSVPSAEMPNDSLNLPHTSRVVACSMEASLKAFEVRSAQHGRVLGENFAHDLDFLTRQPPRHRCQLVPAPLRMICNKHVAWFHTKKQCRNATVTKRFENTHPFLSTRHTCHARRAENSSEQECLVRCNRSHERNFNGLEDFAAQVVGQVHHFACLKNRKEVTLRCCRRSCSTTRSQRQKAQPRLAPSLRL